MLIFLSFHIGVNEINKGGHVEYYIAVPETAIRLRLFIYILMDFSLFHKRTINVSECKFVCPTYSEAKQYWNIAV